MDYTATKESLNPRHLKEQRPNEAAPGSFGPVHLRSCTVQANRLAKVECNPGG